VRIPVEQVEHAEDLPLRRDRNRRDHAEAGLDAMGSVIVIGGFLPPRAWIVAALRVTASPQAHSLRRRQCSFAANAAPCLRGRTDAAYRFRAPRAAPRPAAAPVVASSRVRNPRQRFSSELGGR